MGRASLERPERLAEKLLALRNSESLSQNGLIRRLGLENDLTQAEISAFERGVRIPSLIVLLLYARNFGVTVETLIDDELDIFS